MINKNSKILVTGATGSFGTNFVKTILKKFPDIKRLVVFSRDELKQYNFKSSLDRKHKGLRFFIGDVRDKERLKRALEDIDIVIHAAALKQVDTAEYNPIEYINTNILGAKNLIECCLDTNVKKVVALSKIKLQHLLIFTELPNFAVINYLLQQITCLLKLNVNFLLLDMAMYLDQRFHSSIFT